jgi:hypothetical protein
LRRPAATGIPDDEHQEFASVPPGVAICAVDAAGKTPPSGQGTSGAILAVEGAQTSSARYLLTCKHVVNQPNTWAQPWNPARVRGGWVASSRGFDASILEIQQYDLNVHCLDTRQHKEEKPVVGMRVMKSGAATGLTGSSIAFVSVALTVYFDNNPSTPKSVPGQLFNFIAEGDSGSVAWLGTPRDPRDSTVDPHDYGDPIRKVFDDVVSAATSADRREEILRALRESYRGRAIALLCETSNVQGVGTAGEGEMPDRWARGPALKMVLRDFSGQLGGGSRVIIAND